MPIKILLVFCFTILASSGFAEPLKTEIPAKFDLREKGFVTSVKSQTGGTCWTHSTAAALESNLLVTGNWKSAGEAGEPDLAEYHLDWWNGFNQNYNPDTAPAKNGLTVHEGGDYLVASSYLSQRGAVRNTDGQSYQTRPDQAKDSYHYYYPRHIEWIASDEDDITLKTKKIKEAVMQQGAVGTALAWSSSFYDPGSFSFYQPKSNSALPNHAVTIVGWDDAKKTKASKPGAWLIKNSWGAGWGQNGYFWISFYDKVAGVHPDMGAVSFRDVVPVAFDRAYTLDSHGWRDTKKDALIAMNVFKAQKAPEGKIEYIKAVSFYTTEHMSEYKIRVYRSFEKGVLGGEVALAGGVEKLKGMHTADLDREVPVHEGEDFFVVVELSIGGSAYDKTSDVPVLLCVTKQPKTIVKSKASKGQSLYFVKDAWKDLNDHDATANFAIKALSVFR